jgi:hypothetical protein
MTRLICRKVVLDMLFWIGCKSAKMSVMGFLCEFGSWRTSTLLQKALSLQPIFGEGIVIVILVLVVLISSIDKMAFYPYMAVNQSNEPP